MDEAIRKAATLIEALGWIRRFRGRYVVIKLGGSALEETDAVQKCLTDVIFLETVGAKPILIHGGGKAISGAMTEAGIKPNFVHGRRYTDEQTLEIAAEVLAGEICRSLVDEIERQGAHATPLHFKTENCLIGKQLRLPDPAQPGETIDLGFVGEVTDINREVIDRACAAGQIPVIPCVALDETGHKLNVNGDTAAAAVARLLKAEKLIFMSDVPGIFLNKDEPDTLQSHLNSQQCRKLIAAGVIAAGMVPKVEAALEALEAGVGKIHIVEARMPHSVLLEIYSNKGVGTEIVSAASPTRMTTAEGSS